MILFVSVRGSAGQHAVILFLSVRGSANQHAVILFLSVRGSAGQHAVILFVSVRGSASAYAVILAASALLGFGNSGLSVLSVTYIDENVQRHLAALYIGQFHREGVSVGWDRRE